MNTIKKLREKSSYTQIDLAKKTGLSLRTIQRLETSLKAPKGHTLTVLSKVFNIEPLDLQKKFITEKQANESDILSIKLINISILAFFVIPLGNIILPFIIWKKRSESKFVDDVGRKIINTQILWTIILFFMLCISPFINISVQTSFPLILIVLFIALIINLVVVFFTAYLIQHKKFHFLNLL